MKLYSDLSTVYIGAVFQAAEFHHTELPIQAAAGPWHLFFLQQSLHKGKSLSKYSDSS